MGTIEFWLSVIAIILSVFSLCGNIYVYFRHDRRIKMKEEKALDLELKQKQEAEDEKKKADIIVGVRKSGKYRDNIFIRNQGLSAAHNIRLTLIPIEKDDNNLYGFLQNDFIDACPIELNSSEEFFIETVFCTHVKQVLLNVCWDDNFAKDNHREIQLKIYQ